MDSLLTIKTPMFSGSLRPWETTQSAPGRVNQRLKPPSGARPPMAVSIFLHLWQCHFAGCTKSIKRFPLVPVYLKRWIFQFLSRLSCVVRRNDTSARNYAYWTKETCVLLRHFCYKNELQTRYIQVVMLTQGSYLWKKATITICRETRYFLGKKTHKVGNSGQYKSWQLVEGI